MKELKYIFQTHKVFSYAAVTILFLLLIRIPFGTFNEGSSIDTFAHFALPLFAAPLLYAWLRRLNYLPGAEHNRGQILLVVLLGVSAEVIWEIFEFGVDRAFGLQWQIDNTDTMHDLMLAVIGSLAGGCLYTRVYGWTGSSASAVRQTQK